MRGGGGKGIAGICPCSMWLWTSLGSAGLSWAEYIRFWGRSVCSGHPSSLPALCVGDLDPFYLFIPFLFIPPLLCLFASLPHLCSLSHETTALYSSACSPNTGRSILCMHPMYNHPSPGCAPKGLCRAPHPGLSNPTATAMGTCQRLSVTSMISDHARKQPQNPSVK